MMCLFGWIRGRPRKPSKSSKSARSGHDDIRIRQVRPAVVYSIGPCPNLDRIRRRADLRDLYISHVYTEDPNRDDQPELSDLLKDSAAGKFVTVFVTRLEHISRSPARLLEVLQGLHDLKILVISVDDRLVVSWDMLAILEVMASWEQSDMLQVKRPDVRPRGRPPSYTPDQWGHAQALLASRPDISLSELSRLSGMDRRTLRRKIDAINVEN